MTDSIGSPVSLPLDASMQPKPAPVSRWRWPSRWRVLRSVRRRLNRPPLSLAAAAPADVPGTPQTAQKLGAINVIAIRLDQARNQLSPSTGSSSYTFGPQAISQLPLGASTPVNQILLQAPGVVQDSYGEVHVRGDHGNLQSHQRRADPGERLRLRPDAGSADDRIDAPADRRAAGAVRTAHRGRRDVTTRSGQKLGNGGQCRPDHGQLTPRSIRP